MHLKEAKNIQSEYDKLINGFKNPSMEDYGPVMMWFWNGDISEDGITHQLEKFREQDIIHIFIHPASGENTEYMSDRYMELYKFAVQEMKRLGMKCWIYDEYSFPSGSVGGLLIEKYPHLAQKEITCVKHTLNPCGMRVTVCEKGWFMCAHSLKKKNGRHYVVDVTADCEIRQYENSFVVEYQNDCTTFEDIIFYFYRYNDSINPATISRPECKGIHGYMNIINKEAVQKFIEMTHERYKTVIGDEFGKTVLGVFTDEPTSLRHFSGPNPGPWDDNFEEVFEKEHGYSIIPHLHSLFYEPVNLEEIKVRDDYRTTVKHLYFEAFIKQVSAWCRENNLIFTGHFGGEEYLWCSVSQGDMMTELMYMDIPGIDSIFSSMKIDDYNFNVAGKLVSSAAKFKGANRVLCETYTGSGWDLGFSVMKRVANRLAIVGINMLQYMGAQYTLRESRKIAPAILPTAHSYTNKLFRHYHLFNDYVAGISSLSVATIPEAKVLVFNPVRQTGYYLNVMDTRGDFKPIPIQKVYEDVIASLGYEGIDFDLYSEDMIDNITVYDGYIETCGYRYDYVVFPGMQQVNRETADLLEKLKKHGVKVVLLGDVPEIIVEEATMTGFEFSGEVVPEFAETKRDGEIYLIGTHKWGVDREQLRKTLRGIIGNVALNIKTEDRVYIATRGNEYATVYFIANDENRTVKAEIDSVPGMKIYNTTTREEAAYPVKDERIELTLLPYEMVVAVCDKNSEEAYSTKAPVYKRTMKYALSDEFTFEAVDGNILPVFEYEIFDKDINDWVRGTYMNFPKGIYMERCENYKLRGEVNFEYIPPFVYLNAEIYGIRHLRINGIKVPICANVKRWTEADCKLDVTNLLHEGINTVELDCEADNTYIFARPPFVFFTGKFAVDERRVAVKPSDYISIGGWEKQGYPYFCGDGIYRNSVSVTGMEYSSRVQMWKKAFIEVKTDCVAEVYINNRHAGTVLWEPGILDITDYLHTYDNEIRIVLTSMYANLFEGKTVNGLLDTPVITLYN